MKKYANIICFLHVFVVMSLPAYSQTSAFLEGVIVERQSGNPIQGVQIHDDSDHSTVSGEDGQFRLGLPSGRIKIQFTHSDFTKISRTFYLKSGESRRIILEMNPRVGYEDSATVEAASFPEVENVKSVTPDYVIKAPGAFEDAMQSLQVMPGVIGGSDFSARLFIHGGRPDQNGIFLDGIPIYDPYRLFGLTSLFNPETIDYVKLYPGGFDVRYGDRLSAVVEVENRYGSLNKRLAGSFNASLTNANLVMEGRILDSVPSSWLFSARRTYYDLLLKHADENNSSYPSFTDYQGIFYLQPHPNHQWKLTLLGCVEGTDLIADNESIPDEEPDHVTVEDDQKSVVMGLNGSHLLTNRMRLGYRLAWIRNRQVSDIFFREGETQYDTSFDQTLDSKALRFSTEWEYYSDTHSILLGADVMRSGNSVMFHIDTDDPRFSIPEELLQFGEEQNFTKVSAYLQDAWQMTPEIEAKAGMRWDSSTLSGMSTFSPRASIRWFPSDTWEYRAAWGYYYQFPSYETLQGEGYFLDLRGIKDLELNPERAIHYMVSAEYKSSNFWSISLDAYYKELSDLLKSGEDIETVLVLDDQDFASPYDRDTATLVPENLGSGYARGIDVTFRLDDTKTRSWYGMLTYSFSEAKSRNSGESYYNESWDRTHSVSWVGGWRINDRWDIGWKWHFGTGFPYTPVTRIIRVLDDTNENGQYDPDEGETFSWQRDDPDNVTRSRRFPDNHRLDIRAQYSRRYNRIDATYYLDIINFYGRKNVQDYTYNQDFSKRYDEEGMPLLPSFGVKIKF